MEDMLRQERSAREDAEERARRAEGTIPYKPIANVSEEVETDRSRAGDEEHDSPQPAASTRSITEPIASSSDSELQARLDRVLAEMEMMRKDMKQFQERADRAENDAATARTSLAEMIEKLRAENAEAAAHAEEELENILDSPARSPANAADLASAGKTGAKRAPKAMNGHIKAPSKLPENLERAVATVLRDSHDPNMLSQSAPYASMLGVVLIGVGLMAYLNNWQKIEK